MDKYDFWIIIILILCASFFITAELFIFFLLVL